MKYYRNLELANIYSVSEKAVRNWIDAVNKGKLDLELYTQGDRQFIANTSKNMQVVEELVQRGQKYKNSRALKVVTPTDDFYRVYSPAQVFDMLANIDIHREIPHSYSYFDDGADYWDKYANRLFYEETPNILRRTIQLLAINRVYIDDLVGKYNHVNVVDLGVGNCLPVKDLLTHLHGKGVLNRYIGIDISEEMLEIAQRNITSWFGDQVKFEGYKRDINHDRFTDLLVRDAFGGADSSTVNLVLFLGGTLANFRSPGNTLQVINESLGKNDYLLYSDKVDSESSRRYFDFDFEPQAQALAPQERFILSLLNIDESLYDAEQVFDVAKQSRFIRIRLRVDILIKFEINGLQKHISLNKGEQILLWRARHRSSVELLHEFGNNGFDLMQSTTSPDQEYLLTISKIKTGIHE